MTALRNVLVIGAGGKLGPHVVSAFANDHRFNTSILARNSSASTFPPHLTVHRIDDSYPEAELVKAFTGQDAIISTVAHAAEPLQKTMIDAAVKAGVKRFVPAEFGGDVLNEQLFAVMPERFGVKKDVVDYLKSKEETGLTWTAIVNGIIFDIAMKVGYMGLNPKARKATLTDKGEVKFCATTLETVGLAVKNALLKPDETKNRYLYISSFRASQKDLLAVFEKVTGGKWEVENVDGEETRKLGREMLGKGQPMGAPTLMRYVNTVEGCGGDYLAYRDSANELLGLPKEDLEETLRKIVGPQA